RCLLDVVDGGLLRPFGHGLLNYRLPLHGNPFAAPALVQGFSQGDGPSAEGQGPRSASPALSADSLIYSSIEGLSQVPHVLSSGLSRFTGADVGRSPLLPSPVL